MARWIPVSSSQLADCLRPEALAPPRLGSQHVRADRARTQAKPKEAAAAGPSCAGERNMTARNPIFCAVQGSKAANQRARARLGYRGPHGEPHLMATSGAPVDANGCVASFRKPLDTCDFHYFAAATRRPFSGAWHQQTLKHRHRKPAARTATTQSPRPSKHASLAVARGQMRVRTEINLKRVGPRAVCRVSRPDFGKGTRLKAAQRALCAPCPRWGALAFLPTFRLATFASSPQCAA